MFIRKRKTNQYCIFESCNGAQEVEGRATHTTVAWTSARFDGERILGSDPLPLPISKGYQEPEKGEL
jgi:hypothetical protein